jgi:GR25 family glycosyltransferase involved in LPS biosynthesis
MKPRLVAYLINLDRRPDRWDKFVEKSTGLNLPITRLAAVDGLLLPQDKLKLPMPVAACWMSHQLVAKQFLQSGAEYCLVLEDDIDLDRKAILRLENLCQKEFKDLDLLQIGFCVSHDRLSNRVRYSTQCRLVKLMFHSKLLRLKVSRRFLESIYGYEFCVQKSLGQPVAMQTFELGTHAYVMSSKFAKAILSFNNPVYLPADLALMELAKTEKYSVFRLIESLINQNDSPSSISNASSNSLENEIAQLSSSWNS